MFTDEQEIALGSNFSRRGLKQDERLFIVLSGIGLRLVTHGENHRKRYGPIQGTNKVTMDRLYIGSYRTYQTISFPTTSRDLQDYFIHREPSKCNFEYN